MRTAVSVLVSGRGVWLWRALNSVDWFNRERLALHEHIARYLVQRSAASPSTALVYVDPLDLLSFVVAATERIVLGTGVLLLPYHLR